MGHSPDTRPTIGGRSRGRAVPALIALLIVGGLASAAFYGWQAGWLPLDRIASTEAAGAPDGAESDDASEAASANQAAANAALTSAAAKVSVLEQRLAELNQQANAAAGQAGRAEALLVAFAARRSIERGQPLGYLETQLRVHFGASQPISVDQVILGAQKPVTQGSLAEQFAQLEPRLAGGAPDEGGWGWLSRQFAEMFVIRRDDVPSPMAESRIARARQQIAGGRIDMAIAEVERLPSHAAAADWLARARDYVKTQHALDQLETAAIAVPVPPVLNAPVLPPVPALSAGAAVVAPTVGGPAVSGPAATAAPTPQATGSTRQP